MARPRWRHPAAALRDKRRALPDPGPVPVVPSVKPAVAYPMWKPAVEPRHNLVPRPEVPAAPAPSARRGLVAVAVVAVAVLLWRRS